ncbi:MAG: glycerophosphodiester phosphodiesterase family protein [Boseongicola sp.]|nr:glycerophosphodiester phosphodiesterase family protein [Boseongicola sp.]
MKVLLPKEFLTRPIAHRALHDASDGRPENSRAAVNAALKHGYGIEIDVQLTSDAQAAVFHDHALERLTGREGLVRERSMPELASIALKGSNETIPDLAEVLGMVAGRVPLLIEIKDPDGTFGPDVGSLEGTVARTLAGYGGPAAVMSFNPHCVATMQALAPGVPRGLVTCAFRETEWSMPRARRAELAGIPDYERVGASFISHDVRDLECARVLELGQRGASIICWTVRSAEEERWARAFAANVTFEGYLPDHAE